VCNPQGYIVTSSPTGLLTTSSREPLGSQPLIHYVHIVANQIVSVKQPWSVDVEDIIDVRLIMTTLWGLTPCASVFHMVTGRTEQQFTPDLSLLAQGHYKEFFYQGLGENSLAYLRQPARTHKTTLTAVEHKSWEATAPRDWRLKAACKDVDPDIFFPESLGEYQLPDAPWRRLCPNCPVKDLCLKAATEPGDKVYGVFGGVYFNSRGQMRDDSSRLGGKNPKYPDSRNTTNAERCKAYRNRKKAEIARKSQLD